MCPRCKRVRIKIEDFLCRDCLAAVAEEYNEEE